MFGCACHGHLIIYLFNNILNMHNVGADDFNMAPQENEFNNKQQK